LPCGIIIVGDFEAIVVDFDGLFVGLEFTTQ
jgi:hypothetical protein